MTNGEQHIKDPRVKFGFAQQLQSADSAIKNYFKNTNYLYLDHLSLQFFIILFLLYFFGLRPDTQGKSKDSEQQAVFRGVLTFLNYNIIVDLAANTVKIEFNDKKEGYFNKTFKIPPSMAQAIHELKLINKTKYPDNYDENFSHLFPSFYPQGAKRAVMNLWKHNAQLFFLRNLDFRVFRHRAFTHVAQTVFAGHMDRMKNLNDEELAANIRKILQYFCDNFANHTDKRNTASYIDGRVILMVSYKLKKILDLDIKTMFGSKTSWDLGLDWFFYVMLAIENGTISEEDLKNGRCF